MLCRKASKSSSVSSRNDFKKGSSKVKGPVSKITVPSKASRDTSLLQTTVVKVCGGTGLGEAHFPGDIGSDGSHESENFFSELFGTGIASKSKHRNLYNL